MLDLPPTQRQALWDRVVQAIEEYREGVKDHAVAPRSTPEAIRERLARFDFQEEMDPIAVVDLVVEGLWNDQMHVSHPRYFGLFNPSPTPASIAADALVAAFNPQMATWNHSPFAVETERHLLRQIGTRMGLSPKTLDGTFCTGGAEANHSAILTALTHAFPEFGRLGLRALDDPPLLYISSEGHHSIHKAARLCGLGSLAVREIPVGPDFQMDVAALADRINRDRRAGFAPFLVVATAGTTNAGIVDPIEPIADIAADQGLWLHLDAAWGGAVALVPELRPILAGLDRADSITFDAHKWLSVPMGAGIYFTRHPEILSKTFRTDQAAYMPTQEDALAPFGRSMQWSRRFIGLKVFLSLAVSGWETTATTIRHQMNIGEHLRVSLNESGWNVINPTPLPVSCFQDRKHSQGKTAEYLNAIAHEVVDSGSAWISTTKLGQFGTVLRACITHFQTNLEDVKTLIQTLDQAREQVSRSSRNA